MPTWKENIEELRKHSWADLLIGTYDWGFLCMPKLNPWSKKHYYSSPRFFGRNEIISMLVAAVMGLQHAMATIGGIVTPPRLVYNEQPRDNNKAQYLINAALIMSGFCTLIQVIRPLRYGRFQLGSGVLSVMGTTFTFLPIAQASIEQMQTNDGLSWDEAYGKVLGTCALCGFVQCFLSFVPPKALKRMFPPCICGVVVFLIGLRLCGSGFKNWGGGAFCADNFKGILPPARISGCMIPSANGTLVSGACFRAPVVPLCNTNGFVKLPFGSSDYVGMGLSVVVFMTFLELFGSPFLRNCNVVLSLFFGCFLSGVVRARDGTNFWNRDIIDQAPGITFVWTRTFPLGIYPPMILPSLIAYLIMSIETIGDITATEEASREPTEGTKHDMHVQGGLLGDGVGSVLACLGTSMPNVTFAQNNGVIVLTRCASRAAGVWGAIWLLLFGIIGKLGAFFVAIPDCVLGGMTTFLFANVVVSGIKLICTDGLPRRDRFIVMVSLGVAVGVTIVPHWANANLWYILPDMTPGMRGLRDGIIISLTTPYCIGGLVAMFLHLILPIEASDEELSVHHGEAPVLGALPEPVKPVGHATYTAGKEVDVGMGMEDSAHPKPHKKLSSSASSGSDSV